MLLVTEEPALAAEVQRSAAGAGVRVEVRGWSGEALARWPGAAVVLVGDDAAEAVAATAPRRREGVHLLCRGAPGPEAFRAAVEVGAEGVYAVAEARAHLADLLQEHTTVRAPGRVVALLPGSGGAGATTSVAAVAQAAVRDGSRVVALDCDPWGPGLDRVLGADETTGLGWREIVASPGRIAPASLAEGVPRHDGVGVVAGAREALSASVVRDVVEAARRSHDLVLLDLPRGAPGLVGDLLGHVDLTLLVVRPTLAGVAAAARQVALHASVTTELGLVVRGRGIGPHAVAEAVGASVLAHLPDHPRVEETVDLGLGPLPHGRGAWARSVASLLGVVLHESLRGAA